MREGSLFWQYRFGDGQLTQDKVTFWIDSAKRTFFKEDRNIKYEIGEV